MLLIQSRSIALSDTDASTIAVTTPAHFLLDPYYCPAPSTDLRLSICSDFLCHQNFWMRPTFPDDWSGLRHCFFDPDNMRYFGPGVAWSAEKLQGAMMRSAARNIDPKFPRTSGWTLITHDGFAGCFWAIPSNSANTEIEISYCIAARFAGKNLTTSAGQLVLSPRLGAPLFVGTIFATVHPDNEGSQRVLKKLGLEPDPARQGVSKFGSVRNYYQKHVLPERHEPLLWGFSQQLTEKPAASVQNAVPSAEAEIKPKFTKMSF